MTDLIPVEVQQELTSEVTALVEIAREIRVIDQASLQNATDALGWIAKRKKQVEVARTETVGPLNAQVKAINEHFKGIAAPLDEADKMIRAEVMTYNREQDRIRREEAERQHKAAEEANRQREAEAKAANIEPPPPIVVATPIIPKTVRSDMATTTVKTVTAFEIVDPNLIPRQYLTVNETAIRQAVRSGVREIPGVRIFEREDLVVRAK